MKTEELRKIIREEIKNVLSEGLFDKLKKSKIYTADNTENFNDYGLPQEESLNDIWKPGLYLLHGQYSNDERHYGYVNHIETTKPLKKGAIIKAALSALDIPIRSDEELTKYTLTPDTSGRKMKKAIRIESGIKKEEVVGILNEINPPYKYTLDNWKDILKKDWDELKKYRYSMQMEKIIENLLDELKNVHNQEIWDNFGNTELDESAPSQLIKNKFPGAIDYNRDTRGSEIIWTLISSVEMNKNQIGDFQAFAGYHPAGYGGPNRFNEKILPDGTFEYTWTCYSSSD